MKNNQEETKTQSHITRYKKVPRLPKKKKTQQKQQQQHTNKPKQNTPHKQTKKHPHSYIQFLARTH